MTARPRDRRSGESGHALLIVVVMCMVMIVGTTVAMKVWATVVQREREDELIFRGKQYAMALYLYRKAKGNLPTDLKMLDEKGEGGKFYLRRQYKDPITGQDFGVIMMGPNNTPIPDEPIDDPNLDSDLDGSPGSRSGGFAPIPSPISAQAASPALADKSAFGTPTGGTGLPIMGVHSKSKALAIGPAKWRDLEKYNQWFFLATDVGGQGQGARPITPGQNPNGLGGRGAQSGDNRGQNPDGSKN